MVFRKNYLAEYSPTVMTKTLKQEASPTPSEPTFSGLRRGVRNAIDAHGPKLQNLRLGENPISA